MAWTEQDYQEIVARLMAKSIGVNEVPDAESTDDISSLPAYQPASGTEVPTVVKASLELLVAPALEAADKANEAADKAESNATAAQTAANTANEKAELAAQAASDATAAKEEAEAATQSANNAASNAEEKAEAANNAASNAEEKAEAANTAAQDAEKVANNPTYIGTDHYVYVYNKETDSFDKTGIYCKGKPGSSFRVSGEYATLEALKSAVPDGSAVDGFMAVGTEAPYDYYAWVNGGWVNQGKIAGGGSGNVVVIPVAVMSLSDQATPDEIFNAFGGKDAFMDICQSIVNKDTVCVVANIPEESGMKLVYIPIMAMATYTDANNANFMMAIITETTFQLVVTVTDGVATKSSQVLNHIYEAPSNGNVYGRKNRDWVEVPEKSDVLTKNNETEYTPTKPYHPATKKYVDDKILVRNVDGTILNKWINNTVITGDNPTYIGTDHYVYVYNKETDSFDKTGIYCKGKPGSSFRVSGEYATLEALKSAVPDGSAVDGFMAVGTEAPYDYYAWVNGGWVNQGKIAGGGSGNVVVIPVAVMSLSDQATPDEIFNAFGGKDAFMDICQSIVNKDTVCVVANIPEESGMKLVYIPIMAMATYTDANNANFMMAIITETTFQLVVTVTDGVATKSSQVLNHIYEAPSNGNVYGRKNRDWVEVPEKSDVLTKNNETEYTPTKPYHPATKKYVDDKILVRNVDGTILNKWINNTVITGETVQGLVNELFGNFISFAENYAEGRYRGLRFSARHYDEEAGNYFGYIINANIQYCLSEPGNGYFELLFTFGYGSTLKSCYIYYYDVSETSSENKIVITDVVRSDNLTTLTKKTAAEYEALGSKDANTAYCVTD